MASHSPIETQDLLPNFEYQGEKILATFEGRTIAEGTEFARVAATADEYLETLRKERVRQAKEAKRNSATHITTPNGIKGEILSRVEGVWGDEITVRLENGQHRRYVTAADLGDNLDYSVEEPDAPKTARESLERKLEETIVPNRAGLTARLHELDEVAYHAGRLAAAERNPSEQNSLHRIALSAQAEKNEVREALDHLAAVDAENHAPAAPVLSAVEQADMGRAKGDTWLDVVAKEMIAESEGQDFDRLAAEGPTLLVASLEPGTLADAGVVHEIAQQHVMAKTAGFQGEKVAEYREHFVASVEQARRQELKRLQAVNHQKAASQQEVQVAAPDDALFM